MINECRTTTFRLTLATPIVNMDGSESEKESLTPDDIDVITGYASTVNAFTRILEVSDNVTLAEDLRFTKQISVNKRFLINLDGQSIISRIAEPLFIVDGCTLEITGDGQIDVVGRIGVAINRGTIIINGVIYNPNT